MTSKAKNQSDPGSLERILETLSAESTMELITDAMDARPDYSPQGQIALALMRIIDVAMTERIITGRDGLETLAVVTSGILRSYASCDPCIGTSRDQALMDIHTSYAMRLASLTYNPPSTHH